MLVQESQRIAGKDKWRYALTVRIFRDYEQIFGRFKAEAGKDDQWWKMQLSAIKSQYKDGKFDADVKVVSRSSIRVCEHYSRQLRGPTEINISRSSWPDQPWQQDRTWQKKVAKIVRPSRPQCP